VGGLGHPAALGVVVVVVDAVGARVVLTAVGGSNISCCGEQVGEAPAVRLKSISFVYSSVSVVYLFRYCSAKSRKIRTQNLP